MLPPGRLLYVLRHRGWSAARIDAAPTRGRPVAADSAPEDRVSRPDFGPPPSPAKSHGQTSAGSSPMVMARWSLWCVLSRCSQRKCRGGLRRLVLAAAAAGWSAISWAPPPTRSRLLPGGSRRAGMQDRSGGSSGDHGARSPGRVWPSRRAVTTTSPARLVRRMISSRGERQLWRPVGARPVADLWTGSMVVHRSPIGIAVGRDWACAPERIGRGAGVTCGLARQRVCAGNIRPTEPLDRVDDASVGTRVHMWQIAHLPLESVTPTGL